MISLIQTLSASFFSFALLSIVRIFVVRSPLSEVAGPPKASWWKGNFMKVFDRQAWNYHFELAKRYGGAVRISSFFGNEQLYVFDPLALHHIFVKQQYVFEETEVFVVQNGLVFGKSLLSTLGDHHRKQRKMLNPVFSLKHMRELIPIFYPVAHKLRDVLANQVHSGHEEINVLLWLSRAALEYIAQGGLGYTFNALEESEKNRDSYSEVIKMYGPITFSLRIIRQALPYLVKLGSAPLRRKFMEWVPSRLLQQAREIVDTMDRTSNAIFEEKKRALAEGEEAVVRQVGRGKDIMSVLLRANMVADEEEKLPEEEILGQMNAFIFAGHDTTTSGVSRLIHQLALNPDVQERLRKEVTEARLKHGDLDYDALMSLPYLDAVCRETLRVFPPVPTVVRTCREDTTLPLLWPVVSSSGKSTISSIPLKKNTGIIISILNANRDTRIWGPDAAEWKPERWLGPLPQSVAEAKLPGVYSSMMTFIGGGRACIGFKFAEMEMKLVLSVLLESFIFSPGKDEIYWNMGSLQSPVVQGSGDICPKLPLKVSLVEKS